MNNLYFIMKKISKQHGRFLPTLILLGIFGGVLPTINVIAPKLIIDELMGGKSINLIALYIGLIVIGNFLSSFLVERLERKLEVFITESEGRLKMDLIEHSNRLPIHVSESKSNLDALDYAIFGMRYFWDLIEVLPIIIKAVFSIFTTAIILSNLNIGIPIFLGLSSLLIIPLLRRQKDLEEDNAQRSKSEDRQYIFFVNFSLDFRYAKDLKIFNGSKLVLDKAKENMDNILRINHEYFTKDGHLEGVKGVITEIQTIVVFIYLVFSFINDKLSFGSFIMAFNSVRQMGQSIKQVLEQFNTIILIDAMFKPYLEYINIPLEEDLANDEFSFELGDGLSLRFDKVSFHYPRSEQMILENCSFEIKNGHRVALVGKNGAGKSTIVKLICRFYKPSSGKIYINDIDIEEIPKKTYYKILSIIFQDFRIFPFRISENIACKHIEDYELKDREKISHAINQLHLRPWIDGLKEKEDNYYSDILSKNGVLASGGQGQKIALARSMYHGGSFTIMDEPTAALDPRSEEEIFDQMIGLTKDRTSLFISHRLSSTRFADYILVCDQGRIREEGRHSDLMNSGGLYARMYTAQAEQYS